MFGLERLVILVAAAPGHKPVETPAPVRVELARAAFPAEEVILDEHARTVDGLRAHPEWDDPLFLVGADEFCDFLTWKEPHEVLRRARVGVATRPGYPRERLENGDSVHGFVPADVGRIVEREGLYGGRTRVH